MTIHPFPRTQGQFDGVMHTAFLERASQPGNRERGHALGAFLTLRAVDRIAAASLASDRDGLAFQLRAASNFLDELHPQNQATSHLREIVRVAQRAILTMNRSLLWAPLLAFAYWLEADLRLIEALDVLDTALRINPEYDSSERVAAHLQRGRVLRIRGEFAEARVAYAAGGELAGRLGDNRSLLISRIGRAWVTLKTGDLPNAEAELKAVLATARSHQDVFVEARACHDLAAVAFYAGRFSDAVPLAFRAFELYDDDAQRGRALNDTGVFLKALGHYTAAKEAFLAVLDSERGERRVKTELELLELCGLVQDRVGFERWRKEIEPRRETLPPDDAVDFDLKLGLGLAAFGNRRESVERLECALTKAENYGLGQRIFEIEDSLREIRREGAPLEAPSRRREVSAIPPDVQSAIDSVYALRAGT